MMTIGKAVFNKVQFNQDIFSLEEPDENELPPEPDEEDENHVPLPIMQMNTILMNMYLIRRY